MNMILYFFLTSLLFSPSGFTKKPIWADEFNYEGLPDPKKWSYDVGNGNNGWGNQELQYYTNARKENAFVSNGTLKIRAIKESYEGQEYTSARLVSKKKEILNMVGLKSVPKYLPVGAPGLRYGCFLRIGNMADGQVRGKLTY